MRWSSSRLLTTLLHSHTLGDFTFWISLSLSFSFSPKTRTERKLNQKVKSIFFVRTQSKLRTERKTERKTNPKSEVAHCPKSPATYGYGISESTWFYGIEPVSAHRPMEFRYDISSYTVTQQALRIVQLRCRECMIYGAIHKTVALNESDCRTRGCRRLIESIHIL